MSETGGRLPGASCFCSSCHWVKGAEIINLLSAVYSVRNWIWRACVCREPRLSAMLRTLGFKLPPKADTPEGATVQVPLAGSLVR